MIGSTRSLESILGIVALSLLAIGCVLVLWPFASSLIWAAILTFSTWPVYVRLEGRLHGRPSLAAALMTLLLATAFILPLVLVGTGVAGDAKTLFELAREKLAVGLPPPPGWVASIPLVGVELNQTWTEISQNTGALFDLLAPYFSALRDMALASSLSIGRGLLEITLSVIASFFLYRDGRYAAEQLRLLVHRVAGGRGQHLLQVAGDTITSVVYGIIGTALTQGTLAAIGFWIAGMPKPLLLGIITFFLSLVPPAGPPLVWAPVGLFLLYQGDYAWGIFMLVYGFLVISGVDNFLKPYLISRGTNLPLLLVFLGVIGGILAFGFLGIFLGPTLLAVGYALLREWGTREPAHDLLG
jgi:predicted PurR-regulated permease PerM